jgi:hypothetical protein
LFSVSVIGIAAAQSDTPSEGDKPDRPRAALGQVTSIRDSFFTMMVRNNEVTIQVTDETVFKNRDGSAASFSDLEIDRWVAVAGKRNEDGTGVARHVVLLPEDFDPSDLNIVKLAGEVDKINNGQDTFTIITRGGESVTLNVDDNTRWKGALSELKDLEKGMKVGVVARKLEDGSLLAKVVGTRNEDRQGGRAVGTVVAVGASDLTVDTRRGAVTFIVDGETRFKSRDGSVTGLDDLETGMRVLVVFIIQEDDSLLAKMIGAGVPDAPPNDGSGGVS